MAVCNIIQSAFSNTACTDIPGMGIKNDNDDDHNTNSDDNNNNEIHNNNNNTHKNADLRSSADLRASADLRSSADLTNLSQQVSGDILLGAAR
jgi:hypothetical protein